MTHYADVLTPERIITVANDMLFVRCALRRKRVKPTEWANQVGIEIIGAHREGDANRYWSLRYSTDTSNRILSGAHSLAIELLGSNHNRSELLHCLNQRIDAWWLTYRLWVEKINDVYACGPGSNGGGSEKYTVSHIVFMQHYGAIRASIIDRIRTNRRGDGTALLLSMLNRFDAFNHRCLLSWQQVQDAMGPLIRDID